MADPRVLVVDDDEMNLSALARILSRAGFEVTTTSDGVEALDLLTREPERFDALLLDRMMPGLDGMEVLRRLKAIPALASLPVILQTAMGTAEEVAEGLLAGAFYYLTKPLSQNLVLGVVRTAVEDCARQRVLKAELERTHSALGLMDGGTFRFQTLAQCHELTHLLAKACPDPSRVVVGLSELLINALEHGNLGITYKEKTELLASRGWKGEVARRQALPENHDKWVRVAFRRERDRLRFEIEDEGPGFNWQDYVAPSPARIFDNHGRGILMAKVDSFDRVDYEGRGNRVVAELRIDR